MYVINEKTKIVNEWADNDINMQRLASGKYGVVLYTGEVEEVDGVLYAKGFTPVKSLEELQAEKLAEINSAYTQEATYVKLGTPEDEVSTWDIQRLEAQAWALDNTIATPFLSVLATQREVEREWLINKVLEKVAAFEQYMAALTGKRQKLEDQIKAATTVEEAEAIQWA